MTGPERRSASVLSGAGPAAGALALGGVAWVAAAAAGAGAADGSTRFYLSEVIWLGAQVALLVGTVALWRSRPAGGGRAGGAGFGLASFGRAGFVVAELAALATGEVQDALLPVAALATAVGMVVAGVAVVRSRQWDGWRRFMPLAAGVYPFLAMFPFAASAEDGPPVVTLAGWGAVFVALAAAAHAENRRVVGATAR